MQTFTMLALPLALLAAWPVQSQPAAKSVLLKAPVCQNCKVTLIPSAKLGISNNDGALRGVPRLVVRDSEGRVFITDQNGGAPQVYDSTGRFLRMLGRVGSGPGEFRTASAIVPMHDGRLVVFDENLRRLSVFDASLTFRSSRPSIVSTFDAANWLGDTLFFAANVGTRKSIGLPLHFMPTDKDSISSFGFSALNSADTRRYERKHIAIAGQHICAVRERRLTVTCSRNGTGTPVELSVQADWFNTDSPLTVSESTPPVSYLKAIIPLGSQRVALAVLVGDPNWKRGIQRRTGPDGKSIEIVDYDAYYDTMIYVIDIAKNVLVATTRVPQALMYAVADGYFASLSESNDVPYVALWRVQE